MARLDSRTREADLARGETAELQRQIEAMNAKATDRGLVLTLGDVLFATGRSELRGGAVRNLDQLATFLRQHTERTAIIEGHTDSVGSASSNLTLSQRRAGLLRSRQRGPGHAPVQGPRKAWVAASLSVRRRTDATSGRAYHGA